MTIIIMVEKKRIMFKRKQQPSASIQRHSILQLTTKSNAWCTFDIKYIIIKERYAFKIEEMIKPITSAIHISHAYEICGALCTQHTYKENNCSHNND